MKNMKKCIWILLLLSLCMGLTSCNKLDQLREKHAVFADESHKEIDWNGQHYILAPDDADMRYDLLWTTNTVYVTPPEVPVLLCESEGFMMQANSEKTFIEDWAYRVADISGNGYAPVYIREDKYDEILESIHDLKLSVLCLNTYVYNENGQGREIFALPDELQSVVKEIVSEDRTVEDPDTEIYGTKWLTESYSLVCFDSTLTFGENAGELLVLDNEETGERSWYLYYYEPVYYRILNEDGTSTVIKEAPDDSVISDETVVIEDHVTEPVCVEDDGSFYYRVPERIAEKLEAYISELFTE